VRAAAAAAAVLCLMWACGRPPPPPPPATCADSCLGCCNDGGLCQSGLTQDACGHSGEACAACNDLSTCLRGVCTEFSDGGQFACGGALCDIRSNVCVDGQCLCGTHAACTPGARCVGGFCECIPSECPGCCSAGECVNQFAHQGDACDAGMDACFACTDPLGNLCVDGSCTCGQSSPCSMGEFCGGGSCTCLTSTCPGCCDFTRCVMPADESAASCGTHSYCGSCNSSGDGCADGGCTCGGGPACADGQICQNGECLCGSPACAGCCQGNTCVPSNVQSVLRCGGSGQACIQCPPAVACTIYGCDCADRLVCGSSSVAAGRDHSCAVTAIGAARCWGSNAQGQVGVSDAGIRDGGGDELAPLTVTGSFSVYRAVAAGDTFTCGLVDQFGEVECWGDTPRGSFPFPTGLFISDFVTAVSAGGAHVCANTKSGPQCWGDNTYGQVAPGLLDGGADRDAGPHVFDPSFVFGLPVATQLAAGHTHTCALVDGGVKCWGTFDPSGAAPFDGPAPADVPGLAGVRQIASGDGMTCAALDGGVVCFGSTPTQTLPVDAVSLGVGAGFACAVLGDGSIECWGDNSHGQLGTDAGMFSATPVKVSGVTGATAVSCGRAHACALVSNSQVACWGEGAHGKLGNGTTVDQPFASEIRD
jgi:alpha-tubulin suppressor-like RCC1 family protein